MASFQRTYFIGNASKKKWWNPFEEWFAVQDAMGRRRAIWLYFKSLASSLRDLFLCSVRDQDVEQADRNQQRERVPHVVSISVARSVRSVMANIQQHFVARPAKAGPADSDELPVCFFLHQPPIVLQRATASHLRNQFLGWSLHFAREVGARLRLCGAPARGQAGDTLCVRCTPGQ